MAKKHELKYQFVVVTILIVFGAAFYLFYNYVTVNFWSDYEVHISTVVEGKPLYSLMHRLIKLCYSLPFPEFSLAFLMSAITLGTAYGMYRYLMERMGPNDIKLCAFFVSMLLLFTSNLYIPNIFPNFYTHYTKASQPWHNSTYSLMRFFSTYVICLYYRLYDQVKKCEFKWSDGALFCIALTLCNFAKPSFFLAFAPVSLLTFVYLLYTAKGKNLKHLFFWGCCYLLSIPCMIQMAGVVYDESEKSSLIFSTESLVDYIFGNEAVNGHHFQFLICEFSNLLFPLFVLAVFVIIKLRKQEITLYRLVIAFLMFFTSHLQQLVMSESGPRSAHGNYAWGVYGFGMILFMVCIGEWIHAFLNKRISRRLFAIGVICFLLHMICGVAYFLHLMQGGDIII